MNSILLCSECIVFPKFMHFYQLTIYGDYHEHSNLAITNILCDSNIFCYIEDKKTVNILSNVYQHQL